MENLIHNLEAIIFASGSPIKRSEILEKLPQATEEELNDAVKKLAKKYGKDSGIVLEIFDDKLQFGSNSLYGDVVADVLQPVRQKELTNILMEVLAIVAYKQPVTRAEIEDLRGCSADYAVGVLTRVDLIKVSGYKQSLGRPALYATTDDFLKRFELQSIDELPDYAEVMKRLVEYGNYNAQTEGLYRVVNIADDFEEEDGGDVPDFLRGEDVSEFTGEDEAAADVVDE